MKKLITSLKPNEVFVFGSNFSAFHGAGAAGYAQRGDSKNTWRTDKTFQEALVEYNKRNKNLPYNKEKMIGKWSILGSNGFMEGREGKSYGVITTEKPAVQGIVNDFFLTEQLVKFLTFAIENPNYNFICADFGLNRANGGYSWWTPEELGIIWFAAFQIVGESLNWTKSVTPNNVKFPSYLNFENSLVTIEMKLEML